MSGHVDLRIATLGRLGHQCPAIEASPLSVRSRARARVIASTFVSCRL